MVKKVRNKRVVDNNDSISKKNKGHFIRSEYAQTYMLFFFGIVGSLYIETGEVLDLLCQHLNRYSIIEILTNLSVNECLGYMFRFIGLTIGLIWTYIMFINSDKLKGEQK